MLENARQSARAGDTKKGFCKAIWLGRSNLYNWEKRSEENQLQDAKPIAKNIWWKTPPEKEKEIVEMEEKLGEGSTLYAIAVRTDVSKSTVSNVLKKQANAGKPEEKHLPVIIKSYTWGKRNVCWSMDTLQVRFNNTWVYVLLLVEEISRFILGYRISSTKSGWYSRDLVLTAIARMGIKPLVIKHDRGVEFMSRIFLSTLNMKGIITLPSPKHYPRFNSIVERTNRLMRKFTNPLGILPNLSLSQIETALSKGCGIINYELPRRILSGRTSWEVYTTSTDYEDYQTKELAKKVFADQVNFCSKILDKKQKNIFLDKHRKEVVEYLYQEKLCVIQYKIKPKIG